MVPVPLILSLSFLVFPMPGGAGLQVLVFLGFQVVLVSRDRNIQNSIRKMDLPRA
jgi:hypothetical protein